MPRKRIILFASVFLFLLVAPALLTIFLLGPVLPWWSFALYAGIILVNGALYLSERCWLIDRYFVCGRVWAFTGWSLLLVVFGTLVQFSMIGFSGKFQIGEGMTVADFLGFGLMLSQRIALCGISVVTVLAALAVALSDEWRLAAFKYREAEREKHALTRERDALKGQVDALRRPSAEPESISVKVDLMMTRILLDDIFYVKSDGDYIVIHTADGRAPMVLMTLKALEKQLPFDRFCRIHRSYLVAIDKVQGLQGGKVLVGGEALPLSDSCKPAFFELLSHKSIILSSSGQE